MKTITKVQRATAALLLVAIATCGGDSATKPSDGGTPVKASFVLSVSGAGSGTITSVPAGITCTLANGLPSGTCSASFIQGTTVSLSAAPASDWELTALSGACSGTTTCQVTMSSAQTVGATFERAGGPGPMKLNVTTGAPNTGGLLLTITGGTVSGATGLGGLQATTLVSGGQTLVLVRGSIATGAVADLQVAERKSNFSATVQFASAGSAGGYAALSASPYAVSVARP